MSKANETLYKDLVTNFSPSDHSSILEIGQGNGLHIPWIMSTGTNLSYTAIDLSKEMVKAAEGLNPEFIRGGKVRIVQGNCRKMKFESESFEYVLGVNTLYFWSPIEQFLEEIKRVLKTDGKLILGYRTRSSMMELPFSRYGFDLYEAKDMEAILEKSGFNSISSRHFQEEIKGPDGRKLRLGAVFTLASCS